MGLEIVFAIVFGLGFYTGYNAVEKKAPVPYESSVIEMEPHETNKEDSHERANHY